MNRLSDLNRSGRATVVGVLAMLVITGFAGLLDDRTLNGVSVWAKPIKFNVSFALHVATLMVFVSLLRADLQKSATVRWTMTVTCTAVVLELLYVSFQAARGRASHFNLETQWEEAAYYAMGGGVAVIMVGTLVMGVAVWRGARHDIGPGLRTGAALGAIAGTLATLLTAGAMSSMQVTPTGHWVGGDLTDASGLPVFGWSTTGGDLRVAHFFATHLVQVLPLIGWVADRFATSNARAPVWLATFAGLIVVWLTFEQALTAQPFLSWKTRP